MTSCNKHDTCCLPYIGTLSSGPCPRLPSIRADTSKHERSALHLDHLFTALLGEVLWMFGKPNIINE